MRVFVCFNDSKIFDEVNDFYGSVSTYCGKSAPSVDGDFDTICVPKTDVSVHHKITDSHSYADYIPISMCMFDHHAHSRVMHAGDINLIKKVVGPRGTYSSRCIASYIGINCYEGIKDKTSQDHATPSEGPGMKGQYKYQ